MVIRRVKSVYGRESGEFGESDVSRSPKILRPGNEYTTGTGSCWESRSGSGQL